MLIPTVQTSYTAITDTPQLVIHGVLASRILFNLRQSRETDSEIIGRIFPLAHASQASFKCNDDSGLHPHDHGRVKDPC
ncbi:hypothetical protein M405DRAFT_835763, partial [Rhizopogon salebrosus TDB-379]